MVGGLCCAGVSHAISDFVFPHLHKIRQGGVARRLTRAIREHVDTGVLPVEEAKKRKNNFTSGSMRKGVMTENRMNQDVSSHEEYERCGHTLSSMPVKVNEEEYIESTPAVNADGGMTIAGHSDCHMLARPYNFACLHHVSEASDRLITRLFVNDVPQL